MSPTATLTARGRLAWLAAYWKPHRRFAVGLVCLTLVTSTIAIVYPLVFRAVVDRARSGELQGAGLGRIELVLLLIALGRLLAGFYPGFRAWMNLIIEKAVRERLFGAVLKKDYTFFGKHRTGDLVTRLTDDIAEYPRIAWFACSGIFRFLDSLAAFSFCVAAMLLLDMRLALLAMAPVPVMLYVFYLARRELGSTYQKQQEAVSRTNNLIEAVFSGIRIVKAFGADRGQSGRLGEILTERIGIQLRLAKLIVLVHELDEVVARIGQVIVLAVGGLAVIDGTLSPGTLVAFYVYLDMLLRPMMDLPNLFVTARQAFVSIDRVEEVLRHPVQVARRGSRPAPRRIERVFLEGVSFRYRDDLPRALDAIGFEAGRGVRVAVVGPVGSGKSTLLRLLAGELPVQDGRFALDGIDYDRWDWGTLRARVGYVPQESVLFSETIGENVAFGRDADPEWIRRCLAIAQMEDDLELLPDGLETPIGRKGTLVSGGQKQRIAIARALAGKPDLLLLDDCTASLDARTEDRFWSELDRAFPDAMVFTVSHRLATIHRADTILVLDRGRIVDRGTHAELAARCETYQSFLLTEQRRAHLRKS